MKKHGFTRILRSPILYTLLSGIASGINFLTLILFGRWFSPDDYGVISSWQAFIANAAALMTPLQFILCSRIAERKESAGRAGSGEGSRGEDADRHPLRGIFGLALLLNVAGAAGMVLLGRYLISYLHLAGSASFLLFLAVLLLFQFYTLFNGVPQGHQDFFLLGMTGILFYAGKLLGSRLFLGCGTGTYAVLAGQGAVLILCLGLLLRFTLIREGRGEMLPSKPDRALCAAYPGSFLLYLIASLYLNNGDILAANVYCDETSVGLYTVAVSLAKISVFLIATPVGTVLLPKVKAECEAAKRRKLFLTAAFVTGAVSIAYAVAFLVFGGPVISLVYGAEYEPAAVYIPTACVFSVILGVYWVYYQYSFAAGKQRPFMFASLAGGGSILLAVFLLHPELKVLPLIFSAGMLAAMLICPFLQGTVKDGIQAPGGS